MSLERKENGKKPDLFWSSERRLKFMSEKKRAALEILLKKPEPGKRRIFSNRMDNIATKQFDILESKESELPSINRNRKTFGHSHTKSTPTIDFLLAPRCPMPKKQKAIDQPFEENYLFRRESISRAINQKEQLRKDKSLDCFPAVRPVSASIQFSNKNSTFSRLANKECLLKKLHENALNRQSEQDKITTMCCLEREIVNKQLSLLEVEDEMITTLINKLESVSCEIADLNRKRAQLKTSMHCKPKEDSLKLASESTQLPKINMEVQRLKSFTITGRKVVSSLEKLPPIQPSLSTETFINNKGTTGGENTNLGIDALSPVTKEDAIFNDLQSSDNLLKIIDEKKFDSVKSAPFEAVSSRPSARKTSKLMVETTRPVSKGESNIFSMNEAKTSTAAESNKVQKGITFSKQPVSISETLQDAKYSELKSAVRRIVKKLEPLSLGETSTDTPRTKSRFAPISMRLKMNAPAPLLPITKEEQSPSTKHQNTPLLQATDIPNTNEDLNSAAHKGSLRIKKTTSIVSELTTNEVYNPLKRGETQAESQRIVLAQPPGKIRPEMPKFTPIFFSDPAKGNAFDFSQKEPRYSFQKHGNLPLSMDSLHSLNHVDNNLSQKSVIGSRAFIDVDDGSQQKLNASRKKSSFQEEHLSNEAAKKEGLERLKEERDKLQQLRDKDLPTPRKPFRTAKDSPNRVFNLALAKLALLDPQQRIVEEEVNESPKHSDTKKRGIIPHSFNNHVLHTMASLMVDSPSKQEPKAQGGHHDDKVALSSAKAKEASKNPSKVKSLPNIKFKDYYKKSQLKPRTIIGSSDDSDDDSCVEEENAIVETKNFNRSAKNLKSTGFDPKRAGLAALPYNQRNSLFKVPNNGSLAELLEGDDNHPAPQDIYHAFMMKNSSKELTEEKDVLEAKPLVLSPARRQEVRHLTGETSKSKSRSGQNGSSKANSLRYSELEFISNGDN